MPPSKQKCGHGHQYDHDGKCCQCEKQKMLRLLADIELYLCELPGDIFCAHRPIEEYHALLHRLGRAGAD